MNKIKPCIPGLEGEEGGEGQVSRQEANKQEGKFMVHQMLRAME